MNKRALIFSYLLMPILGLSALNGYADDDQEEVALALFSIEQSGITAQVALARVDKNYPGIIYKYELDVDDGRLVHEVKVLNLEEERKYKIEIDVKTGEVVSEKNKIVWSWFSEDEDITAAKYLQRSTFTLAAALMFLEKSSIIGEGELVYDAELEGNQGMYYFELETYGPDGEEKWLIDIDSQQIIPIFKQ
ncbi:MAG: putative membrane protein YkoI [Kiritimatiellia bacterium]|jgi:uncharacterized membrane protein YkoI